MAENSGRAVGRRAESLADRIEEGAAGLAAFAEGLSEAEWRTRAREGVNLDFSWPEAGDFHPSRPSPKSLVAFVLRLGCRAAPFGRSINTNHRLRPF